MVIELPSRGWAGITKVTIRAPKIDDLRKTSDLSPIEERAKTEFLRMLISNPGDLDKITVFDRDYLFLIVAGAVNMNEFAFTVKCEKCGTELEGSLNLSDCVVKELEPGENYNITKNIYGTDYNFRLLSVADEQKAIDYAQLDESEYPSRYDDATVCMVLGKELNDDNVKWVRDLDLSIYFAALFYLQCCFHGVIPKKTITCKCGHKFNVVLPIFKSVLNIDIQQIMKRFAVVSKYGVDFKSFVDMTLPEYNAFIDTTTSLNGKS